MRPLCKTCKQRPRAINYYKNNKPYYRSSCETCLANGPNNGIPRWQSSGYQLKDQCEKCGYRSKDLDIFRVFHIDGNLNNCRPSNLKTICSNCAISISKSNLGWKQGDLVADH